MTRRKNLNRHSRRDSRRVGLHHMLGVDHTLRRIRRRNSEISDEDIR